MHTQFSLLANSFIGTHFIEALTELLIWIKSTENFFDALIGGVGDSKLEKHLNCQKIFVYMTHFIMLRDTWKKMIIGPGYCYMVAFLYSKFFVLSSFNRWCKFLFFENVTTIPRNQSFDSKLPKDERKLAFLFLITIKNDLHGKFVDALALWQLFVNNPVLSFSHASSFFFNY